MLILKDIYGTTVPAFAQNIEEIETLNDFGQLNFTLCSEERNKVAFELLVPGTKITVPESGRMYRICTNTGNSIGNYKQRTVNALSIGKDLHRKFVFGVLTGTQSLDACLSFLLKDTPFSYEIDGLFKHYHFSEPFGHGYADELFFRLSKKFQFEFSFDNYKISIKKRIGKRNQFVFIDRSSVPKISETSDYTVITTQIHGEGKKNEKGKPLVVTDYTSPKAKLFGLIDAPPISDERFTDKASLLAYMKTKVQDAPFVQYSVEAIYLKKADKVPKVGDYGYLKDRFDIDVEVRISGITSYPQSDRVPKVTFGNNLLSIEKMAAQLQKAKKQTTKYLQETTKQVKGFRKQLSTVTEIAEDAKQTANQVDQKATDAQEKAEKALAGQIFGKVVGEVENY